jgi:hypothetical protein
MEGDDAAGASASAHLSTRHSMRTFSQDWNAHIQRAHPNLLGSGPAETSRRSASSVPQPPGLSGGARTLPSQPSQPKQRKQPKQPKREEVKEEQGWQTVVGTASALMSTVNAQMQAANTVAAHAEDAVRSQPAAKRPAGCGGNVPAAAKRVKQQRQSTTPDVGSGSHAKAQRPAPAASNIAEEMKYYTQQSAAAIPSFRPPTSSSPHHAAPHQTSAPGPSTLQQHVVCRSPPGTPATAASIPRVTPEVRLTCPVRGCKFVNGKCRTFASERVRSHPCARPYAS